MTRRDVHFIKPGTRVEIGIRLHNVSAMIPKGERLRIALAGADRDTFGRYQVQGDPVWTMLDSSFVELPQADWKSP